MVTKNDKFKQGYYKKVCLQCGKNFVAFSNNARFCCDYCSRKFKLMHPEQVKHKPSHSNKPKPDVYCPVRKVSDSLLGSPFSAGRGAVDNIQATSTRTLRRGEH